MRLHSTCVAEKHDWHVQLLHLARLNSPKKNHNRSTNSKVFWIVSLQSDTTSPPVLFITAFAQGREDILNLSSCIHKRALLLNIGRNKDIREREALSLFRARYKWKTTEKASSSGNLYQDYKDALVLAGPGKGSKHPNDSIFPTIWNGLT